MKISTIIFNVIIIFFVLIAFNHIAHRMMVCDLIISTNYPFCNSENNITMNNLDFYALNYYMQVYSKNDSNDNIKMSNCHFKIPKIN